MCLSECLSFVSVTLLRGSVAQAEKSWEVDLAAEKCCIHMLCCLKIKPGRQVITKLDTNFNLMYLHFHQWALLFSSWQANVTLQSLLECIMEGFFRMSYGHKCPQRLRNSIIYIFNAPALVLLLCSEGRTLAAFWRFHHLSDLFLCFHFDPFVINFPSAHVEVVALKLLR